MGAGDSDSTAFVSGESVREVSSDVKIKREKTGELPISTNCREEVHGKSLNFQFSICV